MSKSYGIKWCFYNTREQNNIFPTNDISVKLIEAEWGVYNKSIVSSVGAKHLSATTLEYC